MGRFVGILRRMIGKIWWDSEDDVCGGLVEL